MIDRAKCFPQPHFTHTYDIPHRSYLKPIYKHSCYQHPTDAFAKHAGGASTSKWRLCSFHLASHDDQNNIYIDTKERNGTLPKLLASLQHHNNL